METCSFQEHIAPQLTLATAALGNQTIKKNIKRSAS